MIRFIIGGMSKQLSDRNDRGEMTSEGVFVRIWIPTGKLLALLVHKK